MFELKPSAGRKRVSDQGYVQCYTGNGKGKTTAALGLALRAAGAGMKSAIIQFMKGQHYSELDSLKLLSDHIIIEQYGSPRFCMPDDSNMEEHLDFARRGYSRSLAVIRDPRYRVIILDEIITAFSFDLVSLDDLLNLISIRPRECELVLTGRGANADIIAACDLVTEMKEIKHYYQKGVEARKGIES